MTALRRACTAGSRFVRPLFSILLLAGTAVAGDALATTYTTVLLPMPAAPPGGTRGAEALDINASGEIVGLYFYTEASGHSDSYPVAWSPPDYTMHALPSTDGVTADFATRVNDDGIILGSINTGSSVIWATYEDPFVYMAPSNPSDPIDTSARDINASGIAVGQIGSHAEVALWTDPSTYTVLSVPPGTSASALNDSEMIVGTSVFGFLITHAFRWTLDGGIEDLGDLPGGKNNSAASDVNNSGQVVGYGYAASGKRAVLWDADGTIHDLGNIPRSRVKEYYANRINNVGEVIGSAPTRRGLDNLNAHWVWTAEAGMRSINSRIDPGDPLYKGGEFTLAGLNDAGMLVGSFYPKIAQNGEYQLPILLIPQP